MKRLLLLLVLAVPAHAQDLMPPVAPPEVLPAPEAPKKFQMTVDAGVTSVFTRGERDDFATGRVTALVSLPLGIDAFARGELTGVQNGGELDVSKPDTFRAIEVMGGFRYAIKDYLSVGPVAGFTLLAPWSQTPRDPKLYTLAVTVSTKIGAGYLHIGGGYHGPVDGAAVLLAAVVPMGEKPFLTIDAAIPLQYTALRERAWVIRVGASYLIKSLKF